MNNYEYAISKFEEVLKEIRASLAKDDFHFDVHICDHLYQKILYLVQTFCDSARKKELERIDKKNRSYNNATRVQGLEGFTKNAIEEFKLHDLLYGEKKNLAKDFNADDLEQLALELLDKIPYGIDVKIKNMLNPNNALSANDIIGYMCQKGYIIKENKEDERLSRIGFEIQSVRKLNPALVREKQIIGIVSPHREKLINITMANDIEKQLRQDIKDITKNYDQQIIDIYRNHEQKIKDIEKEHKVIVEREVRKFKLPLFITWFFLFGFGNYWFTQNLRDNFSNSGNWIFYSIFGIIEYLTAVLMLYWYVKTIHEKLKSIIGAMLTIPAALLIMFLTMIINKG
jgi:hypothetical protein